MQFVSFFQQVQLKKFFHKSEIVHDPEVAVKQPCNHFQQTANRIDVFVGVGFKFFFFQSIAKRYLVVLSEICPRANILFSNSIYFSMAFLSLILLHRDL